jgi:serine phosphatase RsbU (regulator of sigma subunit)
VWNEEGASIHITVVPPWWKTNIFYSGCTLFSVLLVVAFVRYRTASIRKEKKILEQKVAERTLELAQKNEDITSSIQYAKRIQDAILPTKEHIQKLFPDSFVLFKPKDIVSGDFYWANFISNPNGEFARGRIRLGEGQGGACFLLCTGDCTGHGVPGAFMSLLNIAFLNEITIERKITRPDLILNELREEIIKAMNPDKIQEQNYSAEEVKDGMDCILCSFDFKNNILNAACANNPLYLVRNGELTEYEPDNFPVGLHTGEKKNFTLHTITLQKGDVIYTASDGYVDQFGGPKDKKFKTKMLKEKLAEISRLPMSEQKSILEKTFTEWKGTREQTDDVTVIGIRIC